MTRKTKTILWRSAGGLLLAVLGGGAWIWHSHGAVLREVAKDIRAGIKSRHAEHPFESYMEHRYGPMTEATNRQKAFLGFFDAAHMEGMYRLVRHMKPEERQKNIAASADWIAQYRETMTPAEKEALADWLQSDGGRATLQQASALFRSRDVGYRSSTEPVIKELMTTLAGLRRESVTP